MICGDKREDFVAEMTKEEDINYRVSYYSIKISCYYYIQWFNIMRSLNKGKKLYLNELN